jgi:hypothetical protein
MENTEIMTATDAGMLENVLVNGDLSKLNPGQRLDYYRQVCQSMGLNPLSKPFDYINLNGKLTLYAKKDATDQLRKIHGVSIDDIKTEDDGDWFVVTVKGSDKTGRRDVEIGAVAKSDMRGNTGNAMMKAVTKAKRRLTLSLCGLGWLDESEIETIPDARPVIVDDQGEIIETPKQMPAPKQPFDEIAYLKSFSKPGWVQGMSRTNAEKMQDSKGVEYGKKSTYELKYMLKSIITAIEGAADDPEKQAAYGLKAAAICEILQNRKVEKTMQNQDGDPFVPES